MSAKERCSCDDFKKAKEKYTDNEGYESLIYDHEDEDVWNIGCELKPLIYCPWCGKKAPIRWSLTGKG